MLLFFVGLKHKLNLHVDLVLLTGAEFGSAIEGILKIFVEIFYNQNPRVSQDAPEKL